MKSKSELCFVVDIIFAVFIASAVCVVDISSQNAEVNENDNVTLVCSTTDVSKTIQFKQNNDPKGTCSSITGCLTLPTKYNLTQTGGKLTIFVIKSFHCGMDNGSWICTYNNQESRPITLACDDGKTSITAMVPTTKEDLSSPSITTNRELIITSTTVATISRIVVDESNELSSKEKDIIIICCCVAVFGFLNITFFLLVYFRNRFCNVDKALCDQHLKQTEPESRENDLSMATKEKAAPSYPTSTVTRNNVVDPHVPHRIGVTSNWDPSCQNTLTGHAQYLHSEKLQYQINRTDFQFQEERNFKQKSERRRYYATYGPTPYQIYDARGSRFYVEKMGFNNGSF